MAIEVPEIDYTEYSNRQLAAVPLAVLAVALAILGVWFVMNGAPVSLGIDFTGGSELTVQTTDSRADIASAFEQDPTSVQKIQTTANEYIVTFQATESGSVQNLVDQANQALSPVSGSEDVIQRQQETSPAFAQGAQQTAIIGIVVAFLGMSLLAFLLFRTFIPSIAIVASAFSDLVIPLALMNLLGIKLSLGTVAALLMLIGYSVDSDILLNNHILRQSGGFYSSTHRAMRTGVTMTLTSLSAMAVMAVASFLFGIQLLTSIGLVLVFGLTADLMNTYMLNLSLLRYYKLGGGVTE
jgi:preprotein translocase subunit SecF